MSNKVSQIGLNVQDLDKAVRDFNHVFGFGWVVLENEELGERIAVSEGGVVLSESIDRRNPSPLKDNWGADIVTALEVKVDDLDAVHEKMTKRGVKPVYYMDTPGGMREWYYQAKDFYGIPMTATEFKPDSWVQSIDENLTDEPQDYDVRIVWSEPWAPWKSADGSAGKNTKILDTITATTENKMAQVAFNVPGQLDEAINDFEEIFGISFVRIQNPDLGLDIGVSDGGLVLSENLDHSNPSPISRIWGGNLITALEIKVPSLEPVHEKLLKLGVKPSYYLDTPGGLREWYYESSFHRVPLTVTEYAQDSFIEAIDETIEEDPSAYNVRIAWEPGYSSWQPK